MKWVWAAILTLMFWAGGPEVMAAPGQTDSQKQKAVAEAKSAKLQKELKVLKREIKKTEKAKESVASNLAQSKAAIARAKRDLLKLSKEQQQTQRHLRVLSLEGARLESAIEKQKERLGQVLRDIHMCGGDQHLKLLLSGDNPNRTIRELQYMAYVTQAQAQLIEQLRGNLQATEENRKKTENTHSRLDAIAQEKQAKKDELEKEKSRRAALLTKLSEQLVAKRKEAKRLERNQKRMSDLVSRLSRLIAKRKSDEAARQRRQLAQSKKEYARKQKSLVNSVEPVSSNDPQDGVFARQRGNLRLPVRGVITEHFGSRPEAGPARKGVFIKTSKGAQIKAVATGKVVFADWLRGFGNLIIIDHGSQYMTTYGNNDALYKKEGDAVNTGDVIAAAGNSGGHEDSGLYFEMRWRGKAFDPLKWVRIR